MPFAEPVMTEGEKLVWAAAFAAYLLNGDHMLDSEASAKDAAEVAFSCVVRLRLLVIEGESTIQEDVENIYPEDEVRAMAHVMACAVAGVAPPPKSEPTADD